MPERHITVQRRMSAPTGSVWALYADFPNLANHWSGLRATRAIGDQTSGVGARRRVELKPMGRMDETVTTWEGSQDRYTESAERIGAVSIRLSPRSRSSPTTTGTRACARWPGRQVSCMRARSASHSGMPTASTTTSTCTVSSLLTPPRRAAAEDRCADGRLCTWVGRLGPSARQCPASVVVLRAAYECVVGGAAPGSTCSPSRTLSGRPACCLTGYSAAS